MLEGIPEETTPGLFVRAGLKADSIFFAWDMGPDTMNKS